MIDRDEEFMRVALAQAEAALDRGEAPVGAVVTNASGDVIAAAGNERELTGDPTAHAEVLAVRAAATVTGGWRLTGCSIYVTLEPCPMCAGALVHARLDRLVYGAQDPRAGAAYSLYNIVQDPRLNHQLTITSGVLAKESAALLVRFFEGRRQTH
jgi:tRNA(adenine34) deaminase